MNMVKRTWAEISLNAIEHNYNVIRNKVADDTKVCCVIKAVSYTHLRAHETKANLVCRLLLEKKKNYNWASLLYQSPNTRDRQTYRFNTYT